jgi:hypothetical protein
MSCLPEALEQFSAFTADYPCGDTPGLCATREDTGAMLKNGKAPPALAGGAQLAPRTGPSEDGYDAGVKTPVAVPKRWRVPSGKTSVTSKLQVTRSPCWLGLDRMSVSVTVSPPVGVNSKVRSKACGMNTAVLPTTWAGVHAALPLTTTWIVCPSSQVAEAVLGVDRVGGGTLGQGRQHQDP